MGLKLAIMFIITYNGKHSTLTTTTTISYHLLLHFSILYWYFIYSIRWADLWFLLLVCWCVWAENSNPSPQFLPPLLLGAPMLHWWKISHHTIHCWMSCVRASFHRGMPIGTNLHSSLKQTKPDLQAYSAHAALFVLKGNTYFSGLDFTVET